MRGPYCGVVFGAGVALAAVSSGCGFGFMLAGIDGTNGDDGEPTGLAAQVAAKALTIGERIGGEDGFGVAAVDGYLSHMEDHMGFRGTDDLADPDGHMTVVLLNESGENSTFDVVYIASHMGIDEQVLEVNVPAGNEVTVELPCSEIIGLGSLTLVGETAVQLGNGAEFENTMCVPAFLGSDYLCGSTYHGFLAADVDDLDADGDTDELIVTTEAFDVHTGPGGMGGHGHMGAPARPLSEEATNGERIFKTGYNIDGQRIAFDDGAPWLYMHGCGCAACHGSDGRGGFWVMMSNQVAPDIRYSHLTEGEHEEDEGHPPYDDALIARAIREGLNPAGETLSWPMPRWDLSDRDMADLIDYLKMLDGEADFGGGDLHTESFPEVKLNKAGWR